LTRENDGVVSWTALLPWIPVEFGLG
jgi:hypothetical protein